MLPRILKLVNLDGYIVKCVWTTGEIRNIDFTKVVSDYPAEIRSKILNLENFNKISLNHDAKTLIIPNIFESNDGSNELDFCPDVLFDYSESVF